jgi:hypothetical protein
VCNKGMKEVYIKLINEGENWMVLLYVNFEYM